MIHSRSKGRPPRSPRPAATAKSTPVLRSTTNAKTRDPQQRALWLAAQRADARKVLASVDADCAQALIPVTAAPTSAVLRMVGTGHDGTGHRGAEVAKMLATGQWNTTMRDKDAAGPLKEDVGLTIQRGSANDYRKINDTREALNAPEGMAERRAAQVDEYANRDHGVWA